MGTNIVLDDAMVEKAMALSGIKTKKELVAKALQEFIAIRQRLNLLDLDGKNCTGWWECQGNPFGHGSGLFWRRNFRNWLS